MFLQAGADGTIYAQVVINEGGPESVCSTQRNIVSDSKTECQYAMIDHRLRKQ